MCRLYRTTSHTKYDLKYHLVWITKYRRAVLSGVVGTRVRELVREICRANDIGIGNRHATVCHVAGLFVLRPAAPLLVELSLPSRRRCLCGVITGGHPRHIQSTMACNIHLLRKRC